MLVLNLPFKALMFLTLMRPSLVLFLVLWLKLVKDFLKVRCRLALLPFLISCLIWLDLVASLPLIKERIQKQPYGRQHTYHHYRTQRPAYEKTESLPRARCGYPSAYGSQAVGMERELKCHKPQ